MITKTLYFLGKLDDKTFLWKNRYNPVAGKRDLFLCQGVKKEARIEIQAVAKIQYPIKPALVMQKPDPGCRPHRLPLIVNCVKV